MMKRIMRSAITKTLAFLLILTCGAAALIVGTDFVNNIIENKYSFFFDHSFESSRGYMSDIMDMSGALSMASAKDAADYLDGLGYAEYSIVGNDIAYGNYSAEQIQGLPYWLRWEKTVEPIEHLDFFPAVTYDTEQETPVLEENAEYIQPEDDSYWVEEPGDIITEIDTITEIIYMDGKAYYVDIPVKYLAADSFGAYLNPRDYCYRDDGAWVYGTKADIRSGTYESYAYYDSRRTDHAITNEWEGSWTVYIGMNAMHYQDTSEQWGLSRQSVMKHIYVLGGILILALLLWIYLLWVCGRRKEDDDVHMLLIDHAFVEFTAVVGMILTFALGWFCVMSLEAGITDEMLDLYLPVSIATVVGALIMFIVTTQSLVRNLKNSTFVSRMLSWRIIKFLWRWAAVIFGWAWQIAGGALRIVRKAVKRGASGLRQFFSFVCGHRISAVILVAFGAYNLVLVMLIGMRMLFTALVLFAAMAVLVYRWLAQLDKLQRGIKEIRGGNTAYKIEGCTSPVMTDAAENLNSINEGVKISVEREVQAQRMKSELITNVSHDLKTPLTSIISYADLLTGMELTPKEANDYAKIIKQKGDRLKKLTGDLFDISKAESGNETIEKERLDMALLLRQSLAELNNEIEKSGLTFVPDIPEKEVFITADGKKLSRVFENLLINAVKYSMSGTRVYVSLKNVGGKAMAEIKNISAAPMNFDPAEITERFVRGDQSRTTEGSGLGLAIARSYTELCGGNLEIAVDGDLFKATVIFKA